MFKKVVRKNLCRALKCVGILFVCMALFLMVSGCSQVSQKTEEKVSAVKGATAYPVTIKDDLGKSVVIEKEPQKIISLSPANTEILFALSLGDKIVGRTDYCNYPKEVEKVQTIGDYNNPNVEKIISLAPDLVLAGDLISDDVRSQLESTGAKVLTYTPMSVEAVKNTIINTGKIVNANDQAAAITETMTKKYNVVKATTQKVAAQKSVFIDIGDYYSAGDNSLLGNSLKDINAKNIAADTGMDWPQLSVEQIIAKNPDVYVSFLAPPAEIKKVSGFEQINALKNNAIIHYEMLSPESDLVQRPGPRIVEGLESLAKAIYPEVF